MNKIIDINDLPKPEDFIASSTNFERTDLKNIDKENLDEAVYFYYFIFIILIYNCNFKFYQAINKEA